MTDMKTTDKPKTIPSAPVLHDRRSMASRIKISPRSLDRLVKARLVPVVRIGRLVRFREDAVLAALARNSTVEAIQ